MITNSGYELTNDQQTQVAINYHVEYAYLLREGFQPARVEHEQHICGLFPRGEWLRLLGEAGFQPEIKRDADERDLFVAHKADR